MTIEFNKIEQSSELGVKGYIVRFDRPYFDGTTRSAKEYEQGLEVFKAEGIKIPLLYLRETHEHKVEIIRGDKVLKVSGPHGAIDYANDIYEQLKNL